MGIQEVVTRRDSDFLSQEASFFYTILWVREQGHTHITCICQTITAKLLYIVGLDF